MADEHEHCKQAVAVWAEELGLSACDQEFLVEQLALERGLASRGLTVFEALTTDDVTKALRIAGECARQTSPRTASPAQWAAVVLAGRVQALETKAK